MNSSGVPSSQAVGLSRAQVHLEPRDHDLDGPVALRQEVAHLREALTSRAVIDQAKGILMARYQIPADRAFDVLSRASQSLNVKVRILAEALVAAAVEGEVLDDLADVIPLTARRVPTRGPCGGRR